MSRKDALNAFTVSAFRKEMAGIFTTSVSPETLDECPMAYKPADELLSHLAGTVKVEARLRRFTILRRGNFSAESSGEGTANPGTHPPLEQ